MGRYIIEVQKEIEMDIKELERRVSQYIEETEELCDFSDEKVAEMKEILDDFVLWVKGGKS